jgi:hypothetical protein
MVNSALSGGIPIAPKSIANMVTYNLGIGQAGSLTSKAVLAASGAANELPELLSSMDIDPTIGATAATAVVGLAISSVLKKGLTKRIFEDTNVGWMDVAKEVRKHLKQPTPTSIHQLRRSLNPDGSINHKNLNRFMTQNITEGKIQGDLQSDIRDRSLARAACEGRSKLASPRVELRRVALSNGNLEKEIEDTAALMAFAPRNEKKKATDRLAFKIVTGALYHAATIGTLLTSFRGFSWLFDKVMGYVLKDYDGLAGDLAKSEPARNLVAALFSFATAFVVAKRIDDKVKKIDSFAHNPEYEIMKEVKEMAKNPSPSEVKALAEVINPDGSLDEPKLTSKLSDILGGSL